MTLSAKSTETVKGLTPNGYFLILFSFYFWGLFLSTWGYNLTLLQQFATLPSQLLPDWLPRFKVHVYRKSRFHSHHTLVGGVHCLFEGSYPLPNYCSRFAVHFAAQFSLTARPAPPPSSSSFFFFFFWGGGFRQPSSKIILYQYKYHTNGTLILPKSISFNEYRVFH